MYVIQTDYLQHHGILGQKWGVRRYQNKDGTLTAKGRERLGLNRFDKDHNEDIVLKKGTSASRVINIPRYDEYLDPDFGGSKEKYEEYVKTILAKDDAFNEKYVSVDGVKNSGRSNGQEYYLGWFTNDGLEPEKAQIKIYELKDDVRVASGKQVVDALLDEVGPHKVSELIKNKSSIKSLTLDYTNDRELFNRVNKRFAEKGYDAIEDINDLDTDMPIIMLNASKSLGKASSIQSASEAIDNIMKRKKGM